MKRARGGDAEHLVAVRANDARKGLETRVVRATGRADEERATDAKDVATFERRGRFEALDA